MDGLSSPRHEQIIVDVYFPLQSDIMPSFLTQHSRDEKVLGTRDVVYQASNSGIGLTFQLLKSISLKKRKKPK